MGRLRNFLEKLIDKKDRNVFFKEDFSLGEDIKLSEPIKEEVEAWVMPSNPRPSKEEFHERNKLMIKSLDQKFLFVLEITDEILDTADSLDLFINDSSLMKLWFAHTAYKNNIDIFNRLIRYPTQSATYNLTKKRSIKCITDLPLQSKLLN